MSEKREVRSRLRALERILRGLRESWVFVEGKKDRDALSLLGITKVLTISGNLRQSCIKAKGMTEKVVVLTDMDRRGDELAKRAREELEACSVKADTDTRRRLAGMLGLRFFEDMERKYREFMEKAEELEKR